MQNTYPAEALTRIATLLQACKAHWVLGGSTGLALRGAKLELPPRDIDIYVDKDSVSDIHDHLSQYVLDPPLYNQTEQYQSILAHYRISNTLVELVGHFRVHAMDSTYTTEVDDLLYPNRDIVELDGNSIPLIPLGHELVFNLLRKRMDRVHLTAQLMAQNSSKHVPILRKLLLRNSFTSEVMEDVLRIASAKASPAMTSEEDLQ